MENMSKKQPRFLPRKVNIPMTFIEKGWGWERWICNGPEYCGKLLFIKKGKRCSWHYHQLKDEVFYLQSGKIIVKFSDSDDLEMAQELSLSIGDNFHVYRGLRHQIIALEDSEIFEFSTQHFDTDSHRIINGD
jgi:quercetin dioxygenase-like cupin family protein